MPQLPGGTGTTAQAGASGKPQTAWAAWVVIAGLFAITTIFGLSLLRFSKASDVATAIGAVSGVIAALVGAYFGIRGATLAQSQAGEMMAPTGTPPDTGAPAPTPTPSGAGTPVPTATRPGTGTPPPTGTPAGTGPQGASR
jgi:hypothetical protein